MKVRTDVKAGGIAWNRCETVAREKKAAKKSAGLKVRTSVKAGGLSIGKQRCETVAREN